MDGGLFGFDFGFGFGRARSHILYTQFVRPRQVLFHWDWVHYTRRDARGTPKEPWFFELSTGGCVQRLSVRIWGHARGLEW